MEQLNIAPNGAVLSSCSKMNSWESNSTTEVPRLLNTGGYQPRIHRVLQLHQYTDPSRDHEKHRTIKKPREKRYLRTPGSCVLGEAPRCRYIIWSADV